MTVLDDVTELETVDSSALSDIIIALDDVTEVQTADSSMLAAVTELEAADSVTEDDVIAVDTDSDCSSWTVDEISAEWLSSLTSIIVDADWLTDEASDITTDSEASIIDSVTCATDSAMTEDETCSATISWLS